MYNDLLASPCTTCSIKTVDNSAYWHPDLYYQYSFLHLVLYLFFFIFFFPLIFLLMHPRWPNGSLSLVPNGGLTIYYFGRTGDNPSPFIFVVLFFYSFLRSLTCTHWYKTNETITGTGDQAHPAWKAFPPGFRMMSGNAFRRTYNPNSVADQAISFAWYLLFPSLRLKLFTHIPSFLLCSVVSRTAGDQKHMTYH